MMGRLNNLKGQKFGRLTVIERTENGANGNAKWLCQCDCGNPKLIPVLANNLRRGTTTSCGCVHAKMISKARKKYNKYDLTGDYGIGFTTNTNKEFYFDLEDYNLIKPFTWFENDKGYIENSEHKRMHRFILKPPSSVIIDHKNTKRFDNRKENLRYANKQTNGINRPATKSNKLGVKGVVKINNKYYPRIMKDGNSISLGGYFNLDDAQNAYNLKCKELFGEFTYEQ